MPAASKLATQDPDHPHMSPYNHTVSKLKALVLVLQAYGFMSVGVSVGFMAHLSYYVFSKLTKLLFKPWSLLPARNPKWISPATNTNAPLGTIDHPYKVAIVGSGFSGLCAIIKMREMGCEELVLLERRDDVGGTWHDNVSCIDEAVLSDKLNATFACISAM